MVGSHDPNFQHETWSSQRAFLLATIGGAVGLGNLWRFPYHAGENGGGAFVLVYIAFVILLCLPLVIAELALGRMGKSSALSTMRRLTTETGASSLWRIVGWLSIAIPFAAMTYYAIIGGWTIDYVAKAATGSFSGVTGEESGAMFGELVSSPGRLLLLHGLFIGGGVFVVARGLGNGIELIMKYMMPALFVLLILLALNSIFREDIGAGLSFMFNADFSKITPGVAIMALGQAFFSVTVGAGLLMTYGAYLPEEVTLGRAAVTIVIADTVIALLAGIIIFPIVFSSGLSPAEGAGLTYITLPIAFGSMPGGYIIGLMFFITLFFAAFSSVIAMLEPPVCFLVEHKGSSRAQMTVALGVTGFLLGLFPALGLNVWSDVRLFPGSELLGDKDILDTIDFFVGSVGIPLNAAIMAAFAGWVLSKSRLFEGLGLKNEALANYVRFTLRFVAPLTIGLLLLGNFVDLAALFS